MTVRIWNDAAAFEIAVNYTMVVAGAETRTAVKHLFGYGLLGIMR